MVYCLIIRFWNTTTERINQMAGRPKRTGDELAARTEAYEYWLAQIAINSKHEIVIADQSELAKIRNDDEERKIQLDMLTKAIKDTYNSTYRAKRSVPLSINKDSILDSDEIVQSAWNIFKERAQSAYIDYTDDNNRTFRGKIAGVSASGLLYQLVTENKTKISYDAMNAELRNARAVLELNSPFQIISKKGANGWSYVVLKDRLEAGLETGEDQDEPLPKALPMAAARVVEPEPDDASDDEEAVERLAIQQEHNKAEIKKKSKNVR